MILILLLAFMVLMPLALWHDFLDRHEARNPEQGQLLRNVVGYAVGILIGIWFFSNVTFY